MVFIVGGANSASGAYEIDNSCQFNTDAYCEFTPSSGSGSTQFTYSAWVKNCGAGALSETGMILSGAGAGSGADNGIQISAGGSAGKIQFIEYAGGSDDAYYIRTDRLFRDPSAWFHLVLIYDAPDGTAGDRMRLYINGTRETSFSHEVQLPQNRAHAGFTRSSVEIRIGSQASGSNQRFNGYLADVYFCDGQNYEPSEFGETNDNGVWVPKKADVSFGTNGFKLEFKQTGTSANASGIGADTSGNDNHFSVSGLAAANVTIDTPTNNFCTLNTLHKSTDDVVLSEGNLKMVSGYSSGWQHCAATMAVRNGKWYWEAKALAVAATDKTSIGVFQFDTTDVDFIGVTNTDRSSKGISGHGAGTGSYTYAEGDIIMCGMDLDNNKVYWGKNGTWFGNLDPAAGSGSTTQTIDNANFCVPAVGGYDDSSWELNFGVPQFSISSGNADANGYGNFEYSVPSGFYALCTKNLAEYG